MENAISLKNKNVLATGGSRGIGAGICRVMASCGANVIINYHQQKESAAQLAKELQKNYGVKTFSFKADVANQKEVIRMFEFIDKSVGSIDVLVNNAGCETIEHAMDLKLDEWDLKLYQII